MEVLMYDFSFWKQDAVAETVDERFLSSMPAVKLAMMQSQI